MVVSGKFQNYVECCSFVQISLRARMVAGPMNVIHNLKGKVSKHDHFDWENEP